MSQEEWIAARRNLLKEEKELTRQQERVAAARRELPWVKVTKDYVFDTPKGKVCLVDLFAGRSQLIIKHNMLNPKHDVCVGCSLEMDHIDPQRGNMTEWARPHDRYDVPGDINSIGQFVAGEACCHGA